jgi:hypothetical protein
MPDRAAAVAAQPEAPKPGVARAAAVAKAVAAHRQEADKVAAPKVVAARARRPGAVDEAAAPNQGAHRAVAAARVAVRVAVAVAAPDR